MQVKFLILLVCLLFISCEKDAPIPTETYTNCLNVPTLSIITDTLYNTPRFNPTNPNEIIYVQGIQSIRKSSIIKQNLITGQKTYVVSDIWQRPDWSVKDWIVFNHADNQVWKIKSNGDSLTLLTANLQGGFNAIWNPDGTKFAYAPGGRNYYVLICDNLGNNLDTLPFFISYLNRWSNNGLNICGLPTGNDFANVVYQNTYTGQGYHPTSNVLNANSTNMVPIFAVDWTPDSQYLIWCNSISLNKTNISTNQTITLKTLCPGRYYTSLSVSSDGKKIIAQRIDVASGLCLMDIDGKNEVIIK